MMNENVNYIALMKDRESENLFIKIKPDAIFK